MSIPQRTSVLVIGGGPAGSMAAMLLAREGVDVTLLEKDRFPRYHIGESMLPGVVPLLRFTGLFDEIDQTMIRKHGAWFKIKADLPPGVIQWKDISDSPFTWNVCRATFDDILLRHAEHCGVKVSQETTVSSLSRDGDRFASADWEHRDGRRGLIDFAYVIDATGMAGLIATKYHRDRVFQENFNNIAIGSYWENYAEYVDPRGIRIKGAPFAESFLDGTGWLWNIPVPPNRLSVGVIMHVNRFRDIRHKYSTLLELLQAEIDRSVETKAVLRQAARVDEVRTWRDYSYASTRFSGPNYRLVGDAAAFIDPLFSQGIHMALLGGLCAASSVCASLRGEWPEHDMAQFHDRYIRRAYTHFIVVLAGWYRQIRNQTGVVLHGISPDTYQLAFDSVRPVISGLADGIGGDRVSTRDLDRTMDYLTNLQLELHKIETGDAIAKDLAREARRNVDDIGATPPSAIDGYHIRMQRGNLGITHV